MIYKNLHYPKFNKQTLEFNFHLFSFYCKKNNLKKKINYINFLFNHNSNPTTINNHIIPAGHYYNWLVKNNKKKNGSNKSRNRTINLIDLNSSLVSHIILNKFSAKEFIFTQELENIFTNTYINDINKKNNSEKIGSIDNIINKVNQNLIKDFWLYQTSKNGEFIIDWNKSLHYEQKQSLIREIKNFAQERLEKKIYFSFLVARDKFYEIDNRSKSPSETTLKIIKIVKKEHNKYKLLIESILEIFLFYSYIEDFAISFSKFEIINHISDFKNIFKNYWNKYKNKIIKRFKIEILNNLIDFLSSNSYTKSYVCSLINSLFITINTDIEYHKQRKHSYFFAFNSSDIPLITRERPLLILNYDKKNMFYQTPKKNINKQVLFLAYHPKILVISGGKEIMQILYDIYINNKKTLMCYYNLELLNESKIKDLKIIF